MDVGGTPKGWASQSLTLPGRPRSVKGDGSERGGLDRSKAFSQQGQTKRLGGLGWLEAWVMMS